tara:strand:- start:22 stop:255 length:234 start_codon:yes stop_codon:yes gene_type:complete
MQIIRYAFTRTTASITDLRPKQRRQNQGRQSIRWARQRQVSHPREFSLIRFLANSTYEKAISADYNPQFIGRKAVCK